MTLIDVVTTLDRKKLAKKVTFWTSLEMTQPETPSWHSGSSTLKPALRPQCPGRPSQMQPSLPPTTAEANDILALKWAFPISFDMIGDMPRKYNSVLTHPFPLPSTPTGRYPLSTGTRLRILEKMIALRVITQATQLTEWVTSLIYPRKQNDTLYICLNLSDLCKIIVWEHYKAPIPSMIFFTTSAVPWPSAS